MLNESFSLTLLEEQINVIEQNVKKIEFIISEILNYKKTITILWIVFNGLKYNAFGK